MSSGGAPVLETGRLILRARAMADFPAYRALWADPSVVRGIGSRALTEEEVWQKFTRISGIWALLGYGFWLVEEKATGAVVGDAGLADFRRDMTPSLDGMPEFGWMIASGAQGRGYATEAIGAALNWADGKFPGRAFCCIIGPGNAPSIRVAEKCGFFEMARTEYNGAPTIVFRREAGGRRGA